MGSRQWAGRHQLWQVNPHLHYRGYQRDRGPIVNLRWCSWKGRRRRTKHSRGTQAGGADETIEKADWEDDVGRHDQRNPQCFTAADRVVKPPTQRTVRGGYWVLGMVNYWC